jgi:DNA-directed RNA polymerase subunit RPC12/RpoP
LQAEPQQVGQQVQCPSCGVVFVIPAPPAQAGPMAVPHAAPAPTAPDPWATAAGPFAAPAHPPAAAVPPAPEAFPPATGPAPDPFAPAEVEEPVSPFPRTKRRIGPAPSFPDVTSETAAGRVAFDPTGAVAGPKMLHIPCPNGHTLETPPEMLGEEVICPHCGSQFMLREKDSQEFRRKKKEDQVKRDIKSGKSWLTWAVVIAAMVVIGLIVMIAVGQW